MRNCRAVGVEILFLACLVQATFGQGSEIVSLQHHDWSKIRVAAQTPQLGFNLVGRWAWGPCESIGAWSHYVFIGNGPTLMALDVSEAQLPRVVGAYIVKAVEDIQMKDSLAFICTGESLMVFDVSVPESPRLISGINVPYYATRCIVQDSLVYVYGPAGPLTVIDITDVTQLRLRSSVPAGYLNFGNTLFAAKDSHIYLGDFESGAGQIVDATNPDSPMVSIFNYPGPTAAGTVRDTLFVTSAGNLYLYSVVDPAHPNLLGSYPIGPSGMTVRDTIAYLTGDAVYAMDVSDPTQPRLLSKVAHNWSTRRITTSSSHAFSACGKGLFVDDIRHPDSIKMESFFATGGTSQNVTVKDSLALVASGEEGLWLVNVKNPSNPKSVANLNEGAFCVDVKYSRGIAYMMNWAPNYDDPPGRGVWIIDINDPTNPKVLSHYVGIVHGTGGGQPNSIALSGTNLFLTQRSTPGSDTVLEIVDVSDSTQPKQVNVVHGQYQLYSVAVRDSLLLAASIDSGLIIFNIKNTASPTVIGRLPVTSLCVAVKDTIAFVVGSGLFVVDIADPKSPQVLGSTGSVYGISNPTISLSGNYVYWVDREGHGIDVSDPRHPIERVSFVGDDYGRGVGSSGKMVYYADRTSGVWIWQNDLVTGVASKKETNSPIGFQLLQNFPNPFNGQTTIRFSLPEKVWVVLEIYDILGQTVATPVEGLLEAGEHAVWFSAGNHATGVYFYQLRSSRTVLTRRMVYLK